MKYAKRSIHIESNLQAKYLLSEKIFAIKCNLGSFAMEKEVYHVFPLKMLKHLEMLYSMSVEWDDRNFNSPGRENKSFHLSWVARVVGGS